MDLVIFLYFYTFFVAWASARVGGSKKKGLAAFRKNRICLLPSAGCERAGRQTTRPNRDKPPGSRDTSTVLLLSKKRKNVEFLLGPRPERTGLVATSWTPGRITGTVIWVFICSDEAGSSCFELFGFGTGSTVSKETECTSRRRLLLLGGKA
jgi:hypothetical protein